MYTLKLINKILNDAEDIYLSRFGELHNHFEKYGLNCDNWLFIRRKIRDLIFKNQISPYEFDYYFKREYIYFLSQKNLIIDTKVNGVPILQTHFIDEAY
jgi:hypothetical protein